MTSSLDDIDDSEDDREILRKLQEQDELDDAVFVKDIQTIMDIRMISKEEAEDYIYIRNKELDKIYETEDEAELKELGLDAKTRKYLEFKAEADKRGISTRGDFAKDYQVKKELLQNHFPGRFTKKQELSKYSPAQIGAVFKKLYDYTEGKIKNP